MHIAYGKILDSGMVCIAEESIGSVIILPAYYRIFTAIVSALKGISGLVTDTYPVAVWHCNVGRLQEMCVGTVGRNIKMFISETHTTIDTIT